MKLRRAVLAAFAAALPPASGAAPVQTSYLWHLHQPIYWPDRQATGTDRYEYAQETVAAKAGGRPRPSDDNVGDIFGLDDRKNAYQGRPWWSVQTVLGRPDAGAQLTFSGALMENVQSLGAAGNLGYSVNWKNDFITGRNAYTSGNKPRLDMVNFTFHHSLAPLQTARTVEMELRLMRRKMELVLGTARPLPKGYFPTEMAFSRHLIPTLKAVGIEWSIVSGNHISRSCADFPLQFGSGGENCEPPNKADVRNPAQGAGAYGRYTISRGCSPTNAAPLAYTPQKAQWVNPDTGVVEKITVVPAAQEFGWLDGYQCFSPSSYGAVAAKNPASGRPMMMMLAHDGDNAFGGGYSYYQECVPNFVNDAVNAGQHPTTVEQYLTDFAIPDADVVHVEDGAWVNADGDFGSPTFINWNYPILNAAGQIDPVNGWHEKAREYAVFLACENRIRTAEQVTGQSPNLDNVIDPASGSTTAIERAWHYFLGSLDSGQVYYGSYGDVEVKGTLGTNEAHRCLDAVLGAVGTFTDLTGPSIWLPQRWPYNPGAVNFGVETQYVQRTLGPDFTVWTFVSDVSGITTSTLRWRVDADGAMTATTTQNETYAGGLEVGPWQSTPMNKRAFPAGNVYNKPELNYFELPVAISDHVSAQITGQTNKLIDYYVEAIDAAGNISRSPIQHVWVGDQTGSGGETGGGGNPTGTRADTIPTTPTAGQAAIVRYSPAGGPLAAAAAVKLHWGTNNWGTVTSPDVTMTSNPVSGRFETTVTVPSTATKLDAVFNNGLGTWDNNGGQDWHFTVIAGTPPPAPIWTVDGVQEGTATLRADTAGGLKLWVANQGTTLFVATNGAASGRDHYVVVTSSPAALLRPAFWAKGGQVAAWDFFLADEESNNFAGWFNPNGGLISTGTYGTTLSPNPAAALEGTIDLAQFYPGGAGALPPTLYVAALAYATPDGGALASAVQAPATLDSNGNAQIGEFYAFPFSVPVAVTSMSIE